MEIYYPSHKMITSLKFTNFINHLSPASAPNVLDTLSQYIEYVDETAFTADKDNQQIPDCQFTIMIQDPQVKSKSANQDTMLKKLNQMGNDVLGIKLKDSGILPVLLPMIKDGRESNMPKDINFKPYRLKEIDVPVGYSLTNHDNKIFEDKIVPLAHLVLITFDFRSGDKGVSLPVSLMCK